MHRRRVQTLHVVECDRRVNHEAKQTRAYHIPKRHGHEKVDRPFVLGNPRLGTSDLDIVPGLESDQGQRHNLQRAEHRSQRHHRSWCSGEIEMMQRADYATG